MEERGHQDIPGVIEGMGDKRLVIGNQIQYRRCKQKETDGRDCYLLLVAIAARWVQLVACGTRLIGSRVERAIAVSLSLAACCLQAILAKNNRYCIRTNVAERASIGAPSDVRKNGGLRKYEKTIRESLESGISSIDTVTVSTTTGENEYDDFLFIAPLWDPPLTMDPSVCGNS